MSIKAPKVCPSCGSEIERVNDQLFCNNNNNCPAQSSKKLQAFFKKLKINGFGEKTIKTLELEDINSVPGLTPQYCESKGFTAHMANKLVAAVKERCDLGIPVCDFIAACSIPLVGDGVSRKLKITRITDITHDLCKDCGVGEKATESLVQWVTEMWPKYSELWEPYLVKQQYKNTQQAICITGKLNDYPNRAAAAKYLESLGYEVKSSVTKQVAYLICEDDSNSSSRQKAEEYGIPVTSIRGLTS